LEGMMEKRNREDDVVEEDVGVDSKITANC
jgi:hypothetical protein